MIENPNVICNDCAYCKQNKELKKLLSKLFTTADTSYCDDDFLQKMREATTERHDYASPQSAKPPENSDVTPDTSESSENAVPDASESSTNQTTDTSESDENSASDTSESDMNTNEVQPDDKPAEAAEPTHHGMTQEEARKALRGDSAPIENAGEPDEPDESELSSISDNRRSFDFSARTARDKADAQVVYLSKDVYDFIHGYFEASKGHSVFEELTPSQVVTAFVYAVSDVMTRKRLHLDERILTSIAKDDWQKYDPTQIRRLHRELRFQKEYLQEIICMLSGLIDDSDNDIMSNISEVNVDANHMKLRQRSGVLEKFAKTEKTRQDKRKK